MKDVLTWQPPRNGEDVATRSARFVRLHRERVPPGMEHGLGATSESLRLGAALRDRAGELPADVLAAVSDVDPVYLRLLLTDALADDELHPEAVCRVAHAVGLDPARLPRPLSWKDPASSQGVAFFAAGPEHFAAPTTMGPMQIVAELSESVGRWLLGSPAQLAAAVRSNVGSSQARHRNRAAFTVPVTRHNGTMNALDISVEPDAGCVRVEGRWQNPPQPAIGLVVRVLNRSIEVGRAALNDRGVGEIRIRSESGDVPEGLAIAVVISVTEEP
jgi:hypothetical protein